MLYLQSYDQQPAGIFRSDNLMERIIGYQYGYKSEICSPVVGLYSSIDKELAIQIKFSGLALIQVSVHTVQVSFASKFYKKRKKKLGTASSPVLRAQCN